jgi:hypothetical protein
MRTALFLLLLAVRALLHAEPVAVPPKQIPEEISRLEGQLKWLEHADVDAFVSYMSRFCLIASPQTRALSNYTEAIAEEQSLVAGGVGENHPRLKSVRVRKQLESDKISADMDRARSQLKSRLAELQKQSQEQK